MDGAVADGVAVAGDHGSGGAPRSGDRSTSVG
jgi:hypothetical protein